MSGTRYNQVTVDVYNNKVNNGEWHQVTSPQYWNGFNAWSLVSYVNSKQVTVELKVIIVKFYM